MTTKITAKWFVRSYALAMFALFVCSDLQGQTPIYFEDAVVPLLRKNCIACHNEKTSEGGLNLEAIGTIVKGGDSGKAIDSQNVDASLLLARTLGTVEPVMPPEDNTIGAERLTGEQIALLKAWIVGGSLSNGMVAANAPLPLQLPESARASYAIAISPDNEFVAFGRAGHLVIQNARRTGAPLPMEGTLDPNPTQIINHAHPDFIYSIAISPDGKTIATGSTGQVKIWKQAPDPIDATRLALEATGVSLANPLCTSNDSTLVANVETITSAAPPVPQEGLPANPETTVANPLPPSSIIRIAKRDGSISHTIPVSEPSILCGTWSPTNNRFYAVGSTNILYSWDLTTQPLPEPIKTQLPGSVQTLTSLDETTLLAISDRKLAAWQYKTPTTAELVADHPFVLAATPSGNMDMIAISSDRTQLATGTKEEAAGNTTLRLWNVNPPKLVGVVEKDRREQLAQFALEQEVSRSKAALDRSNVVIGELDKALQSEIAAVASTIKEKEKAAEALAVKSREMEAAALAIVEHEKLIAEAKAAVEAATQKLNQLTTDLEPKKKMLTDVEKLKMASQTALENASQVVVATENSQKAAQVRLDERKALVTQQDQRLASAQAAATQHKSVSEAIRFSVQSIVFAGKNLLAAAATVGASPSDSIDLFSLETRERIDSRKVVLPAYSQAALAAVIPNDPTRPWKEALVINSPSALVERVMTLAFSVDGTQLAIGSGVPSRSGQLSIVNVSDDNITAAISSGTPSIAASINDLPGDTILALAYSPDGKWLATGGADKMIKLMDTKTNTVSRVLEGHTHHVLGLAWQDDSFRLASASADTTVKVWDVEQGESLKTIIGYGSEITSIAYVGKSSNVITSTLNNLVRIHDTNSGNQVKQFSTTGDSLYCVAVSPNGNYVLSTGQEGIARVWQNENGQLVGEWK